MRFWVYFRGTTTGQWIEASNMKTAKHLFALSQGLTQSNAYITAKRPKVCSTYSRTITKEQL